MNWEEEVAALEAARRASPALRDVVAFYGSSSIHLWESLPQDFPEVPLVNLGFGGSTLRDCAALCDRLVVPWRPTALVVYAGDNDLGEGSTAPEVAAALQVLLGRLDVALGELPFAFLSLKPSRARWLLRHRYRAAKRTLPAVARQPPGCRGRGCGATDA